MENKRPKDRKIIFSDESVLSRFKSSGIDQGWWKGDGVVVAAVSGGSDSMAMLWLLRFFWKGPIVAAHLEHGFRKESSIRDAQFVEDICRDWDVPCKVEHRNVPSLRRIGESLEEAGRRERYQFFNEVAREEGARFIATGHTADDSAETIFFNIIRGTGIRGLRGIPKIRNEVIRPIIECRREELQHFLKARSVPWVTDESNEEVKYFRNKIRHLIFPFLERNANPRLRDHLLSLGADAVNIEKYMESISISMSSWSDVSFPLAEKAWRIEILRMMDSISLQGLFARAGRDLGFSPLSRVKTISLLKLITSGTVPWRFQWERNIEICSSKKMVAIVNRDIFYDVTEEEMVIPIKGKSGTFSWRCWDFEWIIKDGILPWSGDMVSLIKFPRSGLLRVSNLPLCSPNKIKLNRVPWWCLKEWPVVQNGNSKWMPLEGFLPESGNGDEPGQFLRIRASFRKRSGKGDLRNGL